MSDRISPLSAGQEFELGLSPEILADIVNNKIRPTVLDPQDAYEALSSANKRALLHLIKAADALGEIFPKQDHPDNYRAREILKAEAATGDVVAQNALTLFNLQRGVEGKDMYAPKTVPLPLFKNKGLKPGKALYPQDVTEQEVVDYIVAHPEQAAAILGNNTIVRRDGDQLIAEPSSVVFRAEMQAGAREMLAAARETDHAGFAQYLRWHAQALVNDSDPEVMFNTDKAWAGLKDSPLEFTIARESYKDELSGSIAGNSAVAAIIKENNIRAKSKDFIGIRVGIVNQESNKKITAYCDRMEEFAQIMPLREQYKVQAKAIGEHKMSFADVDLVSFLGEYGAFRGALAIAQNLPNDDKLAVQMGEGSRMVFHRQNRGGLDPSLRDQYLGALIDPAQHKLYDENSFFIFVVGHELAHSLGPKMTADGRDKKSALGEMGNIIEENKADVTSIAMAWYLSETGVMTKNDANKIYVTWAALSLPSKQPIKDEAHRMRDIMQLNYFREKGAIVFETGGKMSVVPEKMGPTALKMLREVISIQLAGDPLQANAYVEKYVQWNDAMQHAANERMKLQPRLYRMVQHRLRDRILAAQPA